MKQVVLSIAALFCLTAGLCAQNITVSHAIGQSPSTFLKDNLLAGDGAYVFNVKYGGSASNIEYRSVGTFDANGFDGLGMSSGIIMTTGDIDVAVGPNDETAATMGLYPDVYCDQSLNLMATGAVYGCSTFDFDFVSLSSYFSFNYCFGSEEYLEFCCSGVNDLFVLLLTGPDPETGQTVTRNIAMIPNTENEAHPEGIAVSVNSVNDGNRGNTGINDCYSIYSMYYIDNNSGKDDEELEGVQFDGYTDKLVAEAAIVPCQVYHMHISVCNVGDNAYDSGVFLEKGSFQVPIAATGFKTHTIDTVMGACPFERTLDLSASELGSGTVHFKYGGTAVQGVDYALYDEYGNCIDTNAFYLENDPRSFYIKGLPGANLSSGKTIELYLEEQFCPEVPQMVVHDTQRYVIVRGGDVKVADTTINCSESCFEVSVPLVYGENVSYVWKNLDGTLATGVNNPYSATSSAVIFESRDYMVIATGGSGCNSDTAIVHVVIGAVDIPVDIDEAGETLVRVYPNPASDVIHIEADGLQHVEVFTLEGRLVMERGFADGTASIDVRNLENGVYGLRVTTAHGKHGAKVRINK